MKSVSIILAMAWSLLTMHTIASQNNESLYQSIHQTLQDYVAEKAFNGTVLVAKKGEILYQNSFGYASVEDGIKNESTTAFLIGSTTKSFTAIAVMQCVERGLLDLHAPVKNYIPELNPEVGQLTLHQLMKNSSGLPVHLNRITTLQYRDISSAELLELYDKIHLSFTPGSKFEYANLNYQLCALVVEKVSGLSYPDYTAQYIFGPLQMDLSGVERTYTRIPHRARGYVIEGQNMTPAPKNHLAYAMGGGDIYATAPDLLKWDQALYNNTLLSEKSKALLFDGSPDQYGGYGYGFKIKEYERNAKDSGKLVRHGGSMYGFVCNIHRYLDDEVTIIVLGNIRPYPVMEITVKIEKLLLENGYFE